MLPINCGAVKISYRQVSFSGEYVEDSAAPDAVNSDPEPVKLPNVNAVDTEPSTT